MFIIITIIIYLSIYMVCSGADTMAPGSLDALQKEADQVSNSCCCSEGVV